jgi:hypothetical protein
MHGPLPPCIHLAFHAQFPDIYFLFLHSMGAGFQWKKAFVVSVLGNSSTGLDFTWKTVYKRNN